MSSVMYARSARIERTKKIQKNKKPKYGINWLRVLFWLYFFPFIGACFWVLFLAPFTKIQRIEVRGTERVESNDVRQIAMGQLQGKRWNFLPKDSLFLVNKTYIENDILDHSHYIRSAEIKQVFPNELLIQIQERKEIIILSSQGKDYLVDETGIAFREILTEQLPIMQKKYLQVMNENSSPIKVGQKNHSK